MTDLFKGGESHHISLTISGTEYGFMLPDFRNWQRVDVSDFSPRLASGDMGYRDLTVWGVWAQEHWSHGFGFPYATDERGYAKTGQGVDTRHDGIAMLATDITVSETGINVVKFVDFNSKTYACLSGNAGVREYASGSWGATSQTTGTCLDAITIGEYLVVGLDGARTRTMNTSGTWADAGSDTNNPDDMAHFALHAGYLWASEEGNNSLHYASDSDIGDLEGDGDTDEIVVGPGTVPIVNMISYAGVLYVAREDGLWIVDDTNEAYSQQSFTPVQHADNFKSMCVFKGHLYFTVRQNIYRYTGSTFLDVTPRRYDEVFPYQTYGDFDNLTPRGNFMYCTARNTESSYKESLLAYDGLGWHKLWDVVDTPYVINTLGLSPTLDYLWLSYTGASNTTAYLPLQSHSELPYANFETSGDHYLYSSIHDAGFIDVDKTYKALRMRTNNCDTNQTIDVYYSIDGGAYASLGTVNTSTYYQELTFPACVANTTYGKTLQLRFNFATDTAAQSPILEGWALKYLLRPDTVWGWPLLIKVADDTRALDGRREHDFTAKEKLTALYAARDAKCPCTLTDIWGDDHSVFVTALKEQGIAWRPSKSPEFTVMLSLTDAS